MASRTEYNHAYYRANKHRWKAYGDTYRQKTPQAIIRASQRKSVHGITPEDYARLLEKQGGLCAACRQAETTMWHGILRDLAVDHDHMTGQIRGLLCTKCNVALGLVGDSVEGVRALLRYLEQT